MIDLFKVESLPNRKSFTFGKMPYIQRRIEQNLDRALDFYHFGNKAVRSDHILATVINTANNIPLVPDVNRYIELMEEAAMAICSAKGIGTGASVPDLKYGGYFYGTTELYISTEFPEERTKKWYEAEPVKVVEHQRSDITFTLLDGKPNTMEPTFSVIGIDVPALMLMYKRFRQWNLKVEPDNPMSIPQFVYCWVLPGMIRSHNDLAFRNRILLSHNKEQPAKTLKPELGIIANSYTYVDNVTQEINERFAGVSLDWGQVLQNTPMLTTAYPNAFVVTRQAFYSYTKYGNLIRMLLSIGWIDYVSTLAGKSTIDINAKHIVKLNRMLLRYKNERWIRGGAKVLLDWIVERVEANITKAA